jgi:hypothetical protein
MASKFPNESRRFVDMADEWQQMLPPLKGFEHMPLVTLEEATKPLIEQVPDIEHMVDNVRRSQGKPKHGLTVEESASIVLYSMQWTAVDTSFYSILNSTLRSPARQQRLPPWFLYLKLLITALAKLPSSSGTTICRGVKMHFKDGYKTGDKRVWWGFSSCTSSVAVLDRFMGLSGDRTLFMIESNTGKSIMEYSAFPEEMEILLLPGREFEVMSRLDSKDGLHIIQLMEIQPTFAHIAPIVVVQREEPMPSVELSYCRERLTDADMKRVMQEALIEKRCMSLDLSRNKITHTGVAIIAKAIESNRVRP